MKNKFLTFGTAILFFLSMGLLMACGGNAEPPANAKVGAYYCPMKCEGDKTYRKAGTCPVCKMDLVVVEGEAAKHSEGDHEHAAGEEHDDHEHAEGEEHEEHGHDGGEQMAMYVCPMKCEGKTFHEPGKCPVCKMNLEKIDAVDEVEEDHSGQDHGDHEGHNL